MSFLLLILLDIYFGSTFNISSVIDVISNVNFTNNLFLNRANTISTAAKIEHKKETFPVILTLFSYLSLCRTLKGKTKNNENM